jgi:uncharacterized protein (DUF362 family)
LLYCDRQGRLRKRPARRYFSIIDGIVGGMGEGPMNPLPIESGVILAGYNPLSVDWCAAQLMGFDPESLRVIAGARNRHLPLGPDDPPAVLLTDDPYWTRGLNPANSLRFQSHSCWPHIEAWH